ncbi:MAG: GTP-binding protein [Proteobacteria bacterium]|nr:GTP-binding protein [Pseudomonadota bacterium]
MSLITGFLGSGKTTLLNRALRAPAMRGALVVVNEFGEVGLDHKLVAHSSDNILVLENGCLCCTVFGDLLGEMNRLYHRREANEIPPFDRVLIETSGLADPTSLIQAFLSDPLLSGLFELTATITLIDSVNCRSTLDRHDEAVRQIALADHLVLTKLDMAGAAQRPQLLTQLRSLLRTLNPRAGIHTAESGSLDWEALFRWRGHDPGRGSSEATVWLGAVPTEDSEHSPAGNHHHFASNHLQVASYSFVREDPLPRLALQLLLQGIEQNLGPNLLRFKAIVNVEGEANGPAVIHGAQHLLHNMTWLDRWPFADRKSRFVLIASGIRTGPLGEMIDLLDRIAWRSAKARQAAAI